MAKSPKRFFQFAMIGNTWSAPSALTPSQVRDIDKYHDWCAKHGVASHVRETAGQ